MDSISQKLGTIIEQAKLDQVMAKTVAQRRYAELIENRAIRASLYIAYKDMTEERAWEYFQKGSLGQ